MKINEVRQEIFNYVERKRAVVNDLFVAREIDALKEEKKRRTEREAWQHDHECS